MNYVFINVGSFKTDNCASNEQPNMTPSSLCSLQTFPPTSHSALLNRHRKPAHDITAGVRRRAPYVVCAERKSSRASTRTADDYHATLKALKSKGRFPRKSLGQVSVFFCFVCFMRKFGMTHYVEVLQDFIFPFFWDIFMKIEWGCFVEVFHRTEGGYVPGMVGFTWILRCSTERSSFASSVIFCCCLEWFIWVLHWGLLSNSWWWVRNWVLWAWFEMNLLLKYFAHFWCWCNCSIICWMLT